MTALRAVNAVAGVAVIAASLLLARPGSFGVVAVACLVLFIVGAGSLAADALPLRLLALACSAGTMALAVAIAARAGPAPALGALAVVLQAVAAGPARRR